MYINEKMYTNEKLKILAKYFEDENEARNALRLMDVFHGKIIVDKTVLGADNILLLSIYMLCNEHNKPSVNKNEVQSLFHKLNESEDRKSPNEYFNFYVRRNKKLISKKNDDMSLTLLGLKKVKELLDGELGLKTFIIKSGELYTGKRQLQELILEDTKHIKLCDPYVDTRTLDYFMGINKQIDIRILTQNIGRKPIDETVFKNYLEDFQKQYKNINIKIAKVNTKTLHDRYLITDDAVYSIGASLKDLGNKDTIIIQLPNEIKEALNDNFEDRWQNAKPIN